MNQHVIFDITCFDLNCIINRGGVPESERVLAVVPNDEGLNIVEGVHGGNTTEGSGSGTMEQ